jgi:phosphoribosylpyrophosphate synthetase
VLEQQVFWSMSHSLTLFAGTANPDLAMAVARELGVPLGGCAIEQFPDGEVSVRLNEADAKSLPEKYLDALQGVR